MSELTWVAKWLDGTLLRESVECHPVKVYFLLSFAKLAKAPPVLPNCFVVKPYSSVETFVGVPFVLMFSKSFSLLFFIGDIEFLVIVPYTVLCK